MKKLSLILMALCLVPLSLLAETTTPINSGDQVSCGKKVKLTAEPSSENYMFDKWSDDVTDNPRYVDVTNVVDLKAIFKLKEIQLDPANFVTEGEGTVTLNGKSELLTVTKDMEVKVEATASDPCQEFDHWEGLAEDNPGYSLNPYTFTYDAETFVQIKATFKIRMLSVNADVAEEGQGSVTIEIVEDEE